MPETEGSIKYVGDLDPPMFYHSVVDTDREVGRSPDEFRQIGDIPTYSELSLDPDS